MKIIMMLAQTLDGKIAKNDCHFPDWTSKEDKQYFLDITKDSGVIIMGEKTFLTLPSPLPGRLNVVFTQNENPPKTAGVRWVGGEILPVLNQLKSEGYKKVILGGGAFLNSLFLEQGLIDEIIITLEPKIFGKGISLFSKDFDINLELLENKELNKNTIALKYKVVK